MCVCVCVCVVHVYVSCALHDIATAQNFTHNSGSAGSLSNSDDGTSRTIMGQHKCGSVTCILVQSNFTKMTR